MKKLLLTAAAAVLLATTGSGAAMADPYDHGPRHDQRMDYRMDRRAVTHDRYWHEGYRGFVGRDIVFGTLRAHHYYRWAGDPYWFQGRYVIRTYDRFGHVVIVEINPYTGAYIGVLRF